MGISGISIWQLLIILVIILLLFGTKRLTNIGSDLTIAGTITEGTGRRIVSTGIPGRIYQSQSSTDLNEWIPLGQPQIAPASGVLSVLDPGPLPAKRFYRTVELVR